MHEITVKDLLALKAELETAISDFLGANFTDFRNKTGICINGMNVDIIDVRTIGEPRKYQMGRTHISLSLED